MKLFYHHMDHPCEIQIGAQDPSDNRYSCFQIFGAAGASSNHALQGHFERPFFSQAIVF